MTKLQNIIGMVKAFGSIGFKWYRGDGHGRSCFGFVKSTRHRRRMWNFRFRQVCDFLFANLIFCSHQLANGNRLA